jgi:predicted DNA-binding protein (UPF0251 family)/predicted Fe-Mo cluster-binding NifX family protein
MPRPTKCRRVCFNPEIFYFKPAGIPIRNLDQVELTVEELEALRLKDLEGLEQEEGAEQMKVSRPTFQRILTSARRKTAEALLKGKAIRIGGGEYKLAENIINEREKLLKIAVVSDNGTTISQHFGRAPYYVILTVENGKIKKQEQFERGSAGTCACGHSGNDEHHHASHSGPDSAAKHNKMVDPIADCQVLIAGGMGYGAYQALKSRNLEVFITAEPSIQKAVELFSAGKLDNLMERLH